MTTPYHQALRDARIAAKYTLDDTVHEMKNRLPRPMWVSKGKLQRVETVDPEDKVDIHLIEFLCTLYNVEVATVSQTIAAALDQHRYAVMHLASNPMDRPFRSRCSAMPAQPQLPLGGAANFRSVFSSAARTAGSEYRSAA